MSQQHKRVFLPGFGLKPSMYTSLDASSNAECIDIPVKDSFEKSVSAIAQTIDQPSVLIGYSLGARLALAAALEHPNKVSGLVLISVHTGLEGNAQLSRAQADEELARIYEKNPDEGFALLDAKSVFTELLGLDDIRIQDADLLASQLRVLGQGSTPYMEERLIELRMPVLYVTGSRDPKYCELSARYKKKTPFSHHRIVDSDHRVPLQAPRTLSLLIEWFDSHVVNV